MRGLKSEESKLPTGVLISLNFGEWEHEISGCIIGTTVIFLCGDWCFLLVGWILEHRLEVLNIVQQQRPEVLRIKIYTDSHKL